MQVLPRVATAPRLTPRHVALDDLADLGPSLVDSDTLVTEQRVHSIALTAHSSEFVEMASLAVEGGTLADSDWYRTNWVDVALSSVDAANASFTESGLKRIIWDHCRMTGIQAGGCTIEDAGHLGCPMTMANLRFSNLQRVVFDGCDLTGADFTSARLTDVTFLDCQLGGAQFQQAQCSRVLVAGGSLGGIRGLSGLRGATFRLDGLDEIAQEMASELGFRLIER